MESDVKSKRWFALIGALLVFPQIVETIYSPALPEIGVAFGVRAQIAAQTLSCYFIAFAAGVLAWGLLCDRWGRRPAMLCGLGIYAAASAAALIAGSFTGLLAARICAAFGAAVGSVVTQTIMRDRLSGPALIRAFSLIGVALAVSPVLGLLSGVILTHASGYRGVFGSLFGLAVILLAWSWSDLAETRPGASGPQPLWPTMRQMARDPQIWLVSLLVALFNISLFSYYVLGPFLLEQNGLGEVALALGGLALTTGSLVGARINTVLIMRQARPAAAITAGISLNVIGAVIVLYTQQGWLFLPALALIAMAFAMTVPRLLGHALVEYGDRRGSAGALLGLTYYLLIGGGLAAAGMVQDLGWTLAFCACASAVCARYYGRFLVPDASHPSSSTRERR